MRILITGASGSGTSTLAAAVGSALGLKIFDADDYEQARFGSANPEFIEWAARWKKRPSR